MPVTMRKGKRSERVDRLIRALSVQSVSHHTKEMSQWIVDEATAMGCTCVMKDGNVYVTKGKAELYPAFVAHTDTVHRIIESFSIGNMNGVLFGWDDRMSNMSGIGGDDKVGIFLALQMLDELDAGKAAFFRDEEVGCLGAQKADLDFFTDCAFILQGDRRGYKDVVVRASGDDLCSADFVMNISPIVKKWRKELCYSGLMTDVQELTSMHVGISTINASCGYYRPHSSDEVVSIQDVLDTLNFFRAVTREMGEKRWVHEISARTYSGYGYDRYEWGEGDWADDEYDKKWRTWKKGCTWDREKQEWVPRDGEVNTLKGKEDVAPGRFSLVEVDDKDLYVRRYNIYDAFQRLIAKGQEISKWPGYGGTDRNSTDDIVESMPCPQCDTVAMMVDRYSTDKPDMDQKVFCWACTHCSTSVFDILVVHYHEREEEKEWEAMIDEEDADYVMLDNEDVWEDDVDGWKRKTGRDGRVTYIKSLREA